MPYPFFIRSSWTKTNLGLFKLNEPYNLSLLFSSLIVARDYRNRRIGDFLKELRLSKGHVSCILSICKTIQNIQSLEPRFETDEWKIYFLTTMMTNKEAPEISKESKKKNFPFTIRMKQYEIWLPLMGLSLL